MTDKVEENKGAEHAYPNRPYKDSMRNSKLSVGFRQGGDIINVF